MDPKPPDHIRAFVAVALPDRLLDRVQAEQDRLSSGLGREARNSVRWTSREQLHLTLHFYGNVQGAELESLKSALRKSSNGIAPFELGLSGFGCFPSPSRPNVIWIGLEGNVSTLATLQTQVERETAAYGSRSEDRKFHPHLTIGRPKATGGQARRIGDVVRAETLGCLGTWMVNEMALVRSQLSSRGSTYTRLLVIPLGERA